MKGEYQNRLFWNE